MSFSCFVSFLLLNFLTLSYTDLPQHVDADHTRHYFLDNLRIETFASHAAGAISRGDKDKIKEDTELIRMALLASGAKPTKRLSLGTHVCLLLYLFVSLVSVLFPFANMDTEGISGLFFARDFWKCYSCRYDYGSFGRKISFLSSPIVYFVLTVYKSIVTMKWFAECLYQRKHIDENLHTEFTHDISPALEILNKVYTIK